jgi:tRNA(Ile)-lysidine synthetase-like protein
MILNLEPGKYVAAVSGGVDSMVLLHLLAEARKHDAAWQITVAHFDHGIRDDSSEDRQLVERTAQAYDMPFMYKEGNLGPDTSEATAREARYSFLYGALEQTGSQAIITAHHQDDVLETMVLNMLRGTGRRGMTSLANQPKVMRPFLGTPKTELITYAQAMHLEWHEDTTNTDTAYLRNYVRHHIMSRFDADARNKLLEINTNLSLINRELDTELQNALDKQIDRRKLDRTWFCNMPHKVALEVMATWLRANGIANYDRKTLDRLAIAAKVTHSGRQIDILGGRTMVVYGNSLALSNNER